MDVLLPVINDLSIIIFDLLIFTRMISLKRDTRLSRGIMYIGCTLIVLSYYIAAYVLGWTASVSSMVCMSIPSLILFFFLSKYKDSRFIMTFCFVDTVSLIIAFIGRYVSLVTSQPVGLVSTAAIIILYSVIFFFGKDSFKRYHDLLELSESGWRDMAVSTVLIYFALVFFAAYPEPMVERPEYAPVYLVFSAVVISFYVVFVKSIIKTKQIYEQNNRLEHEKEIFQIAYRDALTGLSNRAAYIECVNRLERQRAEGGGLGDTVCLMFDLNGLKDINDQMGHNAGDRALTASAAALKRAFERDGASLFRLGGDEFCVLMTKASEQEVKGCLGQLEKELESESAGEGFPIRLAAGYVFLEDSQEDTIEAALARADYRMYEDKRRRKNAEG